MRLLVTGGGTGGHVFPAIAVARQMTVVEPDTEILFVGTSAGMERGLAEKEGLPFRPVRSQGVVGKSPLRAAIGLGRAAMGVADAISVLRWFKPDAVLGTGGYASGPIVMAAWLLGIPRAIQEQNAIPGVTNQFLARISDRVFAAFEYSVPFFPKPSKVTVTGNPIKDDLGGGTKEAGRAHFGLPSRGPCLLLTGGSRGAKTLVEAGLLLAESLPGDASFIFATGKEYYQEAQRRFLSRIDPKSPGNIIMCPFIHDMPQAYWAADVVVGRAGGMTISEITSLGLASVIVPSPNVANNHQDYNAKALGDEGAAVVEREGAGAPERIKETALRLLGDPKERERLGEAASRMGRRDATQVICEGICEMVAGRTGQAPRRGIRP